MRIDAGFRQDVRDCAPAVRSLTDREVRAFACACLAELARREGVNTAASWAADQAQRLALLDGQTAA